MFPKTIQAQVPAALTGPQDAVRLLVIDAGRRAELHYVAPGTVVDTDDGQLERHAGGFIRDDRPWLQDLARLAFEWYGRQRQAFTLSYRQASGLFYVGDLITTIGKAATLETVRTVITEVRIELAQSTNDVHRTSIRTQWAELDALQLI